MTKQMIENRDWKEVRGLTEDILCRLFSNQGETATLTLFGKKHCTLTKELLNAKLICFCSDLTENVW